MYLYSVVMAKTLHQITFDFSASVNENEMISVSLPEEKLISNQKEQSEEEKNTFVIESKKHKSPSSRGRRSLKDIGTEADLIQVPPDEILFQKQYYAIGEVSKMFRVNQSLLRYWETEFDILQPKKNRKGDRFFRAQDVKHLQHIYDLLRRRKFTIEGAKEYLKKNKRSEDNFAMIQTLERIKVFLLELKASL